MRGFWAGYLDVGYPTVGSAAYAVVVSKVAGLRRVGWDPALAAMAICPFFVGTAFLVATPFVYRDIDSAASIPNLATLLVYGLITAFGATAQVLLVLWPTEQHLRRNGRAGWRALWRLRTHLGAFAVTLGIMIGLFLASDGRVSSHETPVTFDTSWSRVPPIVAFLMIYQGAFATTLLQLANLCRSLAREPSIAERRWMVLGLRLIARGSYVALGYGLCKVTAIIARVCGTHVDVLSTIVGPEFASVGALLMAAGFSASIIGPRLVLWRHHRQIAPLQALLLAAVPGARLPRTWLDVVLPRGWRSRDWQRQVMEVRDATEVLGYYAATDIAESTLAFASSSGLSPQQRRTLAEAAVLRSGLSRYRLGHRQALTPQQVPAQRDGHRGRDVSSDLKDLNDLAGAYFGPITALAPQSADPAGMDPQDRLRRVVLITHPEDLRIGLTLGLWRTFAIPAIARELAAAGGLIADPAKRASATGEALLGLMEEGLGSATSQGILSHLKRIHDGMHPELMLYVLTCFTLVPTAFIDTYGWRPLDEGERRAFLGFSIGLAQELGFPVPGEEFEQWQAWAADYEREHLGPSPQAAALWASAGSALAVRRLPRSLRPLLRRPARSVAAVLLDAPVGSSLEVPEPSRFARWWVGRLLAVRRWHVRRARRAADIG